MARKGISVPSWRRRYSTSDRVVPVTVVKAGPNVVPASARSERDGYSVQLAYGEISPRKVNKPLDRSRRRRQPTPIPGGVAAGRLGCRDRVPGWARVDRGRSSPMAATSM